MIIEALDPDLGAVRTRGNPIKLSGYEDATTRPPAPALDGNRQAILDWLGLN